MATPNQTGQAALGVSRDIYIHSKLLMIDDCFMTLGSANLNLRSMSADSEINLATDSIGHVRPFRRRVWGMQTGGEYDGGDGSTQKVSDAFEKWKALSLENKRHIDQGLPEMTGFIVQFEDKRTAMHRYG
jgi:phosphatidylserine/phosphatidylglycerophosphate/cardiolipin synthase-like enzyme